MSSRFRSVANGARRLMIRAGLDRLVAWFGERAPRSRTLAKLRPDCAQYRRPTIRRARRDGLWFDLDLSDYMQWTVYYSVEKPVRARLYDLAVPGNVAIDVGANIGEVLLNFAQRVGPTGRAIGFEAHPETVRHCMSNLALNAVENAEVHGVGLGKAEGKLAFGRQCVSNSGADRFMAAGEGTIEVPVTALDDFADRAALDAVDLIKIDVEGFEMNVLLGGERTIERFRPVMFIELCDDNLRAQGSSAAELVGWLDRHGYTSKDAATNAPVAAGDELGGCFLDIICWHRSA
jgi:FkbM family methyltransferase